MTGETSAATTPPPASREGQLGYMAGVTFLSVVVVSVLLGHSLHRSNPLTFWCVEIGVIGACLYVGFYDGFEAVVQANFQNKNVKPTPFAKFARWLRHRWGNWIVSAGVVANMAALWQAVDHTGGALRSPFAALLAAPAIFGAFVAQSRSGIVQLLAASAVTIIVLDLTSPGSEKHGWISPAVSAVTLLVGAGFISWLLIGRNDRATAKAATSTAVVLDVDELRRIVNEAVQSALQGGK
jgi:hypothetical protein